MRRFFKARKIFNILGVTFILGPAVLGFLMFVGIMIYDAINYPTHPLASKFYTHLREVKKQGKHPVYMTDLTPFKWEVVCFLYPYSTIESALGDEYIAEPVLAEDGFFHIAFGLPDKHTVPVSISREFYDLNHQQKECITYQEASRIPLKLPE